MRRAHTKLVPITCPNCGSAFKPTVWTSKYCSRPCQHAWRKSPAQVEARFWEKVDKSLGPNACWIWMGAITSHGYGCVQTSYKVIGAHKLAYQLTKGEVPAGMQIMHSCDSPPCVNPAHLSIGTRQDNVDDKVAKGRTPKTHRKILNADNVREIRSARGSIGSGALADKYGVSQSHIFTIWAGKTWKKVA